MSASPSTPLLSSVSSQIRSNPRYGTHNQNDESVVVIPLAASLNNAAEPAHPLNLSSQYANAEAPGRSYVTTHTLPLRLSRFRHQHLSFFARSPKLFPSWTYGGLLILLAFIVATAIILPVEIVQFFVGHVDCHPSDSKCGPYQNKKSVGQDLGNLGAIFALIMLLPVTRNSVWIFLLGVSFEKAIQMHVWAARYAISILVLHMGAIVWYYSLSGTLHYAYQFNHDADYAGAGFLALFFAFAALLTSFYFIRRHLFEFFYRIHIPLWLGFFVLASIHKQQALGILIAPLLLWLIDWFFRIRSIRKETRLISLTAEAGNIVRIEFEKSFTFEAGQYVFLCFPEISHFEYHPFSISSSPFDKTVVIHLRAIGNFTRSLHRLAQTKTLPKMYVEGPYGTLKFPLETFQNVVIISGGIGITPMFCIYKSLCYKYLAGQSTNKVHFIWSIKNFDLLSLFNFENTEAVAPVQQSIPTIKHSIYISDPQHEAAILNQTRPNCTFTSGRPNLNEILDFHLQDVHGSNIKQIAVLVSGPESLIHAVQKACSYKSTEEVTFWVHSETFLL